MLKWSQLRKEIKMCLFLAIPLAAAQLAQSATGFVDTVMMGLLGSQKLAAGSLGATMFTVLLMITSGVLSAVSPLVAEAYGAGQSEQVRRFVQQGLWLSVLLAIPLSLVVWNGASVLSLLGQQAETVTLAEGYLKAIAWGCFPGLGFVVLRSYIAALSQTRPVMLIVILGTLLNIAGNYVFMFGKLGFPEMGLAGIGWASALSFWAMFLSSIFYILWKPLFQQYQTFQGFTQFNGKMFKKLLKVGVPISGLIALEAGLFATITLLMGRFGTVPLAAHQVALQSAALSFNVPLGISMATTVRVGQLLGQKDIRTARLAGFIGIWLSGLFMGAMAIVFWRFPERIVALYLDLNNPSNLAVVDTAKVLLGIAAVFQIVDGIQVAAAGALRGLQDTQMAMLIALFAYWGVGLPSCMLLAYRLGLGATGLWWGAAMGLAAAAIVLPWRFNQYTKGIVRSRLPKPSLFVK